MTPNLIVRLYRHFFNKACEGPGIGKSLAAVVAGEDHAGVVGHPAGLQCIEDAADLLIKVLDHAPVGHGPKDRGVREVMPTSAKVNVFPIIFRSPARLGPKVSRNEVILADL